MATAAPTLARSFLSYPWQHGELSQCDPGFPSTLYCWDNAPLCMGADATFFGYVFEGTAVVASACGEYELSAGMYFCLPGRVRVRGGRGIVMARLGFDGVFQIGGPIEPQGRLRYIDGCTDSLLIPPIRLGDPCLNLLCFPPGIDQTPHTHPSDRIGVVASGSGECETDECITELKAGMIFRIVAGGLHKFRTNDQGMRVIAYHPDSDFGPTDEVHPMINRTMIDGVSASELRNIHTAA